MREFGRETEREGGKINYRTIARELLTCTLATLMLDIVYMDEIKVGAIQLDGRIEVEA